MKNLQKWNLALPERISFPDKAQNNESYRKGYAAGYNFILHSSMGIEFFPIKTFVIRIGYNPQKRRELGMAERTGLAGFSFGTGIRILKMNFDYARSIYNFAGASNHITLSINPFAFSTTKTTPALFKEGGTP